METIPLELPFKGERDYLHGTDMYNAITAHFSVALPAFHEFPMKMVIHGFARRQLDLVCAGCEDEVPEAVRAQFGIGEEINGWLVESERQVTERIAYPEEEMVNGCRIDGSRIVAPGDSRWSPIEMLVALTKRLHLALWGDGNRWAFTRLDLVRPLREDDKSALVIELEHTLGTRLTRSRIQSGPAFLGHVYFSSVKG